MSCSQPILHVETRTHLGPYRLLEVLGEGGTARVYLGQHEVLGKQVAIKTLLPELDRFAAAREMFLEEARIASSIVHPNLVEIYDFAKDAEGRPYCVMELASGQTLAHRVDKGPLPLSQCLDIAIRVADAIAAVHAAGVLHRDIKTENVILTRAGRSLVPKLIDFGIARRMSKQPADELEVAGTPRTMSPEQIARDPIDERTDIWALGVMLYEMMTGTLPFPPGETVREDFIAILTEPPAPLDLGFPEDVRRLVEACLSKDPKGRPATAVELRDRLERARAEYCSRQDVIERALVEDEAWRVLEELELEAEVASFDADALFGALDPDELAHLPAELVAA